MSCGPRDHGLCHSDWNYNVQISVQYVHPNFILIVLARPSRRARHAWVWVDGLVLAIHYTVCESVTVCLSLLQCESVTATVTVTGESVTGPAPRAEEDQVSTDISTVTLRPVDVHMEACPRSPASSLSQASLARPVKVLLPADCGASGPRMS
jgi:hypothetical protein